MYWIATGLIFVFFYINVPIGSRTVDILPDILGYVLIGVDLYRMRKKSRFFGWGVLLCAVLAVYSVSVRIVLPTGILGVSLSVTELVLQLLLLYLLVYGIKDLEREVGVHLNSTVLDRWRIWLSVVWVGSYLFVMVGVMMPTIAAFGVLLMIAWFLLCVLFLVAFYRTAHRYKLLLQRGLPAIEAERRTP